MYQFKKLHNWPKNLVNIDFLTHFSISISWNLIEIYFQFEIVAHYNPTMIAFFIFFIWLLIFLNIIKTILFTWLVNNMQFTLQTIFKVKFIIKPHTIPVFWPWISLFHHLRLCFAITRRLLIYLSFFTCYIFAIMHKIHSIFYHLFYEL